MFIYQFANLCCIDSTSNSFYGFSTLDYKDCRNIANVETFEKFLVILSIVFPHDYFSFIFVSNLGNNRSKSLARSTPCSPKINDYEAVL